jgi:hypothetical protein
VLTVYLPSVLGLDNRQRLIEAIEGEKRRFLRVRLDASAVTDIDGAGLGILARVVRLARDRTSQAPLLRAPTDCAIPEGGPRLWLSPFDVGVCGRLRIVTERSGPSGW